MDCPVCLDEIDDEVRLACGHTGCRACLDPWLRHNASCPLCRHAVDDEVVDSIVLHSTQRRRRDGRRCLTGSTIHGIRVERLDPRYPSDVAAAEAVRAAMLEIKEASIEDRPPEVDWIWERLGHAVKSVDLTRLATRMWTMERCELAIAVLGSALTAHKGMGPLGPGRQGRPCMFHTTSATWWITRSGTRFADCFRKRSGT